MKKDNFLAKLESEELGKNGNIWERNTSNDITYPRDNEGNKKVYK